MLRFELFLACLLHETEQDKIRWRRGFRRNCYIAILNNGALRIERYWNVLRLVFLDSSGMPRWEFFCHCQDPDSPVGDLFDLIEATEKARRQVVKKMLQELNG